MSLRLEASRTVPVSVDEAFAGVLPVPLERIFGRRYAAIAGITEVRDQEGDWGIPGQARTIVQSDGGQLHETLIEVDEPNTFAYTITVTKGLNGFLIGGIVGRWSFEPAGTGTRITWTWEVTPTGRVAKLAMPVLARMWQGYARQGLEEIEKILVTG